MTKLHKLTAAITGHTTGLGNSFFRLLQSHGYETVGFSRSNGYDLRDYTKVGNMLEHVRGFDLFINNAKPDYAQSQILYRLARSWTQGTIVSIGSRAVIQDPKWNDTFLLEYLTQKTALCHAHNALSKLAGCRMIIVHPEHLGEQTDQYVEELIKKLNL
jgi:hypothetical protein